MSNDFLNSIEMPLEQFAEDGILNWLQGAFKIRTNQLKGDGSFAPVIQGVAGAVGGIAQGITQFEGNSLIQGGKPAPLPTGQITEALGSVAIQALNAGLQTVVSAAAAHSAAVQSIVAHAATTRAVVAPAPVPAPVIVAPLVATPAPPVETQEEINAAADAPLENNDAFSVAPGMP